MVNQQAPEVYGSLNNLINDEFVNQLRKDVEIMIKNLSQSSKGQTVARARVPRPTLNIPITNPLAPPRQRTRAATCFALDAYRRQPTITTSKTRRNKN